VFCLCCSWFPFLIFIFNSLVCLSFPWLSLTTPPHHFHFSPTPPWELLNRTSHAESSISMMKKGICWWNKRTKWMQKSVKLEKAKRK
jgi:hypothetical protein